MPLFQEPTFHDIQCVIEQETQTTDDTDFVDLTNATLTTKNLSQPSLYIVFFSVLVSSSLNNSLASFRVTIDGNPQNETRDLVLKIKEQDIGFTFLGCAKGVTAGQVIQGQWKTDIGILTMQEFNIVIMGTPTSRIVE